MATMRHEYGGERMQWGDKVLKRVLGVGAIGQMVGDCLMIPGIGAGLVSKRFGGFIPPGAQPSVWGVCCLYFWTSLGKRMRK